MTYDNNINIALCKNVTNRELRESDNHKQCADRICDTKKHDNYTLQYTALGKKSLTCSAATTG